MKAEKLLELKNFVDVLDSVEVIAKVADSVTALVSELKDLNLKQLAKMLKKQSNRLIRLAKKADRKNPGTFQKDAIMLSLESCKDLIMSIRSQLKNPDVL